MAWRITFEGRGKRFIDYEHFFLIFRSAFRYVQISLFSTLIISVISGLGIVLKTEGTKLSKTWSFSIKEFII